MIQYVRKFFISLLLLWFLIAICMMVSGTNLFFPFDLDIDHSEKMYRYKTIRFAAGCLLAYAVFRYLFSFKATPSLGIVFNYGFFYLAGGIIFAYRDNVETHYLLHHLVVAFLLVLIWFELRQKIRDEGGKFKRDHF